MKRFVLASLTTAALCLTSISICSDVVKTQAQVCSGCEVSQQTITKANNLLNLTEQEKVDAEERYLLGGIPVPPTDATNEHMIHQHEWISWYDDDLRLPLWVFYELTKADASKQLERKDSFRKDPRLADEVASVCADYDEDIFSTVDTWYRMQI